MRAGCRVLLHYVVRFAVSKDREIWCTRFASTYAAQNAWKQQSRTCKTGQRDSRSTQPPPTSRLEIGLQSVKAQSA